MVHINDLGSPSIGYHRIFSCFETSLYVVRNARFRTKRLLTCRTMMVLSFVYNFSVFSQTRADFESFVAIGTRKLGRVLFGQTFRMFDSHMVDPHGLVREVGFAFFAPVEDTDAVHSHVYFQTLGAFQFLAAYVAIKTNAAMAGPIVLLQQRRTAETFVALFTLEVFRVIHRLEVRGRVNRFSDDLQNQLSRCTSLHRLYIF